MKRFIRILAVVTLVVSLVIPTTLVAKTKKEKTAIVLASFGTSYPNALKAIINIEKEVKKEFGDVAIKHAFTSNIIRKKWHKRRDNKAFQKKGLKQFCYIKGPLATIADLQDEGYKNIIVQSTHIFAGEEYEDLCSYVDSLNKIKTHKKKFMPFNKLVVGRPALGKPGDKHPYHHDIEKAVKAVKADVKEAQKMGATLVYMGHGNEYFSTGAYVEFQAMMNKKYKVKTLVGVVEGYPSVDDVSAALKHMNAKKILLKPLMVVAGDHASNDMAGDEDDSWKVIFKKMGIDVKTKLKGLGENKKWARIYVKHLKDVAKDNDIKL
ncbi:MAG: sirohydrochlorin cobaltochelatase [Deltaproteobacteria bacterium]|nr:sirohydrochlorin cobaltochelatase [Deltaproteobacteria bacterium]